MAGHQLWAVLITLAAVGSSGPGISGSSCTAIPIGHPPCYFRKGTVACGAALQAVTGWSCWPHCPSYKPGAVVLCDHLVRLSCSLWAVRTNLWGAVSASEIPKGFEPQGTSLGSVRREMQTLPLWYQTLIKQLNALGSTLIFPNVLDCLVLLHIMELHNGHCG